MSQYKWDSLIPLREKQQDQYEPQMEQIIQYGEYIGLQFPGDESLLYIAKQGITATLPPQWQACQTQDGQMVYRNILTREITEQHPLDEYYRNKVIEIRHQQNRRISSYQSGEGMDQCILDAIEEEKHENSDSNYSGQIDEQQFQILKNSNSTKRYHLRHEEQFTRRVRENDNSNDQSQFFQPYNKTKSKNLKIKTKPNQYDNFLAQFSSDYSLNQHINSVQQEQLPYHASLNINLPTEVSNKFSPQKSRSINPSHKPSPNNESSQIIHKIKELNQQLSQYKNQKQLKQTLLNQIKQTNRIKLQLIKEKLNKKAKPKKNKINQKLQQLIST